MSERLIERLVSGGQTGVDQSSLFAAYTLGIPTGGYAPLGWLTEDGPNPSLADYGLIEWSEPGYDLRTKANLVNSDGTILIGKPDSPGSRLVMRLCSYDSLKRPLFCINPLVMEHIGSDPAYRAYYLNWVRNWIKGHGIRTLNVAGNRESIFPGVGEWTYSFITDLLT